MKVKIKIKAQWYMVLLVLGILVYSMLCWLKVFKNTSLESVANREMGISAVDHTISELENMWTEQAVKRETLSLVHLISNFCITGQIDSEQVILGKNGWLFYSRETDGDPIGEFEGTKQYSQDEKDEILEVMREIQTRYEEQGKKIVVFVAANKESVYSEFMPETYSHMKISGTDQLISYLEENGIKIISSKRDLLEEHSMIQLYYLYDTHWNQQGAYIGVKSIMDFWNIPMPELPKRDIVAYELKENYHFCAVDDLAKMVGVRFILDDEMEYEVKGTGRIDWEEFEEEQEEGNVSHYHNSNANLQSSVFIIGDSFRTAMIPALVEMYQDVYVADRLSYKKGMLEDVDPEYIILEFVERYSDQIKEMENILY